MKVESCKAAQPTEPEAESRLYYQLATGTKINITSSATADVAALPRLNSAGMERHSGLAGLQARVAAAGFAGYGPEVVDALKVAAMGLGLSHLLRPAQTSTMDAASAAVVTSLVPVVRDLMRPPKGLILYGAPGTGKTTLMHAIVTALDCNYLELSHSLLLSRCGSFNCVFEFPVVADR